ncbi:CopG family transcriptional regulator [Halobacteriales archaeon QS_6_71_20]|nr:MAG: CopG family transcriptional regulator [Halobacteriales archaeon QS_6_71_20]
MTKIEVDLPDRIDSEIARLAEQGEFLNRNEAIEDFLTRGLQAYDVENDQGEGEADGDLFTDTIDEQQDPAALDEEHGDEPTF